MKQFKCAACGQGQVVMLAKPGRRAAFKNIPDLEIPESLELPTCECCGEEWLDDAAAKQLDVALADVYRRELSRKANQALRQLKMAKLRQWDLEPLLGLSSGYLSKVKAGKDVSPTLVVALMLLAGAPNRVEELRRTLRCSSVDAPFDNAMADLGRAHVELPKTEASSFGYMAEFAQYDERRPVVRLRLVGPNQTEMPSSAYCMPTEVAA
ncbi:hypothetical protein [Myxococcus sp. AS-1-15]|uniref:hypothetical protein n=1 Tax=Myxococcus sp. AS-1-15 TaxID=2874600 RepID=UPI001CBA9424|nr:hypothetical protein [Myxococcus sp. AS-1-15]MBZ4395348.1 hypothetical protein [Myxococcus sp. AS-1-15]